MLRAILSQNNISLYQLEKTSQISHATLNDIYNERSNIDNCSIIVMSKIAHSLNMDTDTLYRYLSYKDLSLFAYNEEFDLFKSDCLQRLKRVGDNLFLEQIIESKTIEKYFKKQQYQESLYLLSLVDYLCNKNKRPLLKEYDEMRNYQLSKIYVSKSIYLLLLTRHISVTSIYKECLPEFIKHNIVEANIYDVI